MPGPPKCLQESAEHWQVWLGGGGDQTGGQRGAGLTQGLPLGNKGACPGRPAGSVGGRLSHFSGAWGLTGQVQGSKRLSRLMSAKPLDCP